MIDKKYAAVALGALVIGGLQMQISAQNKMINAGLSSIAANQAQLVVGQAAGNATLSMIHTATVESLAMQQTQTK